MPKFTARITKTVELEQTIEFEAENEDAADALLVEVCNALDLGNGHALVSDDWDEEDTRHGADDLDLKGE